MRSTCAADGWYVDGGIMQVKPSRAYSLKLSIEADTKAELVDQLEEFARQVFCDELGFEKDFPTAHGYRDCSRGMWGGVASGGDYRLLYDASMTHDRYVAELKRFLETPNDA